MQTVKWQWKSDQGWIDYPIETTIFLEESYISQKTNVKIDEERFVDFTQMLQKRIDDPLKVRPIARKGPSITKQNQQIFGHLF